MKSDYVSVILRHTLTIFGAYLIGNNIMPDLNADGVIDHVDTEVFVGAAIICISTLWGIYKAKCASHLTKLVGEAKQISPMTIITAEQKLREKKAQKKAAKKPNGDDSYQDL